MNALRNTIDPSEAAPPRRVREFLGLRRSVAFWITSVLGIIALWAATRLGYGCLSVVLTESVCTIPTLPAWIGSAAILLILAAVFFIGVSRSTLPLAAVIAAIAVIALVVCASFAAIQPQLVLDVFVNGGLELG